MSFLDILIDFIDFMYILDIVFLTYFHMEMLSSVATRKFSAFKKILKIWKKNENIISFNFLGLFLLNYFH